VNGDDDPWPMRVFNAEDFHVDFRADGSFTITVDGDNSTAKRAPKGVYRLHSNGDTQGPRVGGWVEDEQSATPAD
jgi:hypothetical protein